MEPFEALGDGGVRLRGFRYGGPGIDAPALLLHHGLASSQRIWDLMVPSLTRRFTVVTYDARGHGRSAKPSSGYGFEHVIEDALAVARSTRLGAPVIVGHSWGAMAALELAARRPDAVAGVVLVDGGLAGPSTWWDWPTTKQRLAPPPLAGMPLEEFRTGLRKWSPIPVTPAIEEVFLSLMRVRADGTIEPWLSRANHLRILRAIWEQRPLDRFAELRVPTLAIAARSAEPREEERAFIEAKRAGMRAARLAARGNPVRFSWMQGVHDLPIHHPRALANRIARFAAAVVE